MKDTLLICKTTLTILPTVHTDLRFRQNSNIIFSEEYYDALIICLFDVLRILYSSVSSKNVLEIMESSDTFWVKMQITYSSAFSPMVMILRIEYQQLFETSGLKRVNKI